MKGFTDTDQVSRLTGQKISKSDIKWDEHILDKMIPQNSRTYRLYLKTSHERPPALEDNVFLAENS